MSALMIEPRTEMPELSTVHLLQVRYALTYFEGLADEEQVTINTIVDSGSVGDLSEELNDIYTRLREKKLCNQTI